MITWLPVHSCSKEVGDEAMESSMNEGTDDGGSLLNQAKAGPFNLILKALHRTGSWYPCSSI